jgi:hypothetical protein
MTRGVRLDFFQQTCGGGGPIEIGTDEQARSGRRCEGYGDGELRVIAPADSGVSLCPGKIKHELAVGVALAEGGRRRRQSQLIGQGDVGRIPPRPGADTVGVLESRQEFVSQERVAISSQGIPLPRVELVDAVMGLGVSLLGQECFSTSNPSRYLSASSAAIQPAPAEVMAWR